MSRSRIQLRVRYAETDQMGVVYHANYLAWCEVGRTELMRQLGFPYAELEKTGTLLVVAEASLRYHAPARYDDLVWVDTAVESVRSRAVTFEYRIAREENGGALRLVTARTTLVPTTPAGGSRSLPPSLLETLRAAQAGGE